MVNSTKICDTSLLKLDAGIEIEEVNTFGAMDHKHLSVCSKAGILKEVNRILLFYKRLLVIILVKSNFSNKLKLVGLGIIDLYHKQRWLLLNLFGILILRI